MHQTFRQKYHRIYWQLCTNDWNADIFTKCGNKLSLQCGNKMSPNFTNLWPKPFPSVAENQNIRNNNIWWQNFTYVFAAVNICAPWDKKFVVEAELWARFQASLDIVDGVTRPLHCYSVTWLLLQGYYIVPICLTFLHCVLSNVSQINCW